MAAPRGRARGRIGRGGTARRLGLGAILALTAGTASAEPATTCAIDMGSNSFKRIVGSFAGGRYQELRLEKKTLGVGDDLSRHGRISDAKLAEIEAALAAFQTACKQEGAARIAAIGTAAFREAPNGPRVVEIAARLGIPMEIASEERESRLAYLVGSLGRDGYAVIDNGSRSIELVSKQAGREPRHSVFNLGYRIAYERFFAAADSARAAVDAFRAALRPEAAKAPFMRGMQRLVGVEFEEMAELLFDPGENEGRVLPLAALARRLEEIRGLPPEGFAELKAREDIDRALPRLVVAVALAEEFGYGALELTTRELGAGLIIEAGIGRP
jgi:hypothetical protein